MARRGKQAQPTAAQPQTVTAAARVVRKDNVVVLPSVRNYRTWSPGMIRSAEVAADGGNLRLAVDLCDWILSDDKVSGALEGRTNALFGLPLSFEADRRSDGRRRTKAQRALEVDEDWWASFRQPEIRQMSSWAIVLGFGPARTQWTTVEGHGGRVLPVQRFYHPQPIRYDWPSRDWRLKLDNGSEESIEWGNADWVGHFPFGTYRPWAQGRWRGLARWCLLKAYAIGDWGRAGEKASRDVVEAATELDKNDSTRTLRQELANDIYEAARDGVIVLPRGFTYKAVETVAGTKDIFESQINAADMAIAVALRGSNLTSGIKPGAGATYGAAKQHGEVDHTFLKADAEAWEETSHDQVLVWWAEYNFGDRTLAPWPEWETDDEEDRSQLATTMQTAATGLNGLLTAGFDVDQQAFIDRFGFDFLVASKEPLKPAPKTPPGQPPPPPSPAKAELRLASGDKPSTASGFVDGQLYADAVADFAARYGASSLSIDITEIAAALQRAKSFEELKAELVTLLGEDFDPDELAEVMARAMVLSELGGRLAARQDIPELKRS